MGMRRLIRVVGTDDLVNMGTGCSWGVLGAGREADEVDGPGV